MNNIKQLGLTESRPKIAELTDRVNTLILEYDGEVGFLEVLGMLDFLKSTLTNKQWENVIDE
jgi:hypothetical protein